MRSGIKSRQTPYLVGACSVGAADWDEDSEQQMCGGGAGGAGHSGTMQGGFTCSGKFKQDLCWGMSTNSHFFSQHCLGAHFGVSHFGVSHFGVSHFGVSHFGVAHCGMRHSGMASSGVAHCGVVHCEVAHGSGAGHFCFRCQACALLDSPRVPISAQKTKAHRCGRMGISPRIRIKMVGCVTCERCFSRGERGQKPLPLDNVNDDGRDAKRKPIFR